MEEDERQRAERELCARLGIDPALPHLGEALTHPSYSNEQRAIGVSAPDNQRLEFLGDAVVGLCVSELLVAAFAAESEGQLTLMRASLVSGSALAAVARDIGVAPALRVGRGADATGERNRPNVLADAFEALIGCVYLDAGLDTARAVVRSALGAEVARLLATGGVERDAKSRLQEMLQARGLPAPRYRVVAEQGPAHAREFVIEVVAVLDHPPAEGAAPDATTADGAARWTLTVTGEGRSKKQAEQAAASAALARLEKQT
jgi:ribonuclease III